VWQSHGVVLVFPAYTEEARIAAPSPILVAVRQSTRCQCPVSEVRRAKRAMRARIS